MKNKEFDELFKGKLEQINPDYNPGSWDSLVQKMEQVSDAVTVPLATKKFDNTVKESIENYSTSYNP